MKTRITIIAVIFALTIPAGAQSPCPCVPTSYVWMSSACDSWNCVMTEMGMNDGGPWVMAVPTGASQYAWVMLKRVKAGSYVQYPPDPFVVDSYGSMAEAAAQFDLIDPAQVPKLVTTVDGKVVIIRLREADPEFHKRRAVRVR